MSREKAAVAGFVETVLANDGAVPFQWLVRQIVPVKRQRELCRELGLSPKGGFRLEKAPAKVLAPLLAEVRDAGALERIGRVLLECTNPAPVRTEGAAPKGDHDGRLAAEKAARERESARREAEVVRARSAASRARERVAELERRLEREQEAVVRLRAALARSREELERAAASARGDVPRELQRRLHEQEKELLALGELEEAWRRQDAERLTQIRALEDKVVDLEERVPKSRRERRRLEAAPPPPSRRVLLPYLAPEFYRSLEGKEWRSVERAVQAVMSLCTYGPGYPGLEVKQIGGQDLWSLRAALKLRVYFRWRDDRSVEFVALADREDQPTTLRRLKR